MQLALNLEPVSFPSISQHQITLKDGCSATNLYFSARTSKKAEKGKFLHPCRLRKNMKRPICSNSLRPTSLQVLETRTETPELQTSLATLSTFYEENTPAARRNLRTTTENEGLKISEDFLTAAGEVIGALDIVQADLDSVSSACEQMTVAIRKSKSFTAGLIHETQKLQHALQVTETRQKLIVKFLDQYQLLPAEIQALQGEQIADGFFTALQHVKEIHSNCKNLLQTNQQRAGLELMDSMGALQEAAYERLCRWVQAECRELSEMDAPEVNPLLQRAAAALMEREVLFKYCAEEVSSARHTALFQRFIKALTRGPRPIEMHAPDPRRYVSDMLAWLHTSLASEREFLISLFGDYESENSDIPPLSKLLDSIFESICRPLKVRIEQVLMSSPPPLLCYRISQLLSFYLNTVDSMLGADSQLSDALTACKTMALRIFHDQLKQRGDKLSRYPPPPAKDLSPPPQLSEGVRQISELIECFECALEQEEDAGKEFSAVLASALNPLVDMCRHSSEALNPAATSRLDDGSHLNPADQSVYVINCLLSLQVPLVNHKCAEEQLAEVAQLLNKHIAALVSTELDRILKTCGLKEIMDRIDLYKVSAKPPTTSQCFP